MLTIGSAVLDVLIAAFTRQTEVGKLKLVIVNGTKTVGIHVAKLLARNRTYLYSRQRFHQLFRFGKLVLCHHEKLSCVPVMADFKGESLS